MINTYSKRQDSKKRSYCIELRENVFALENRMLFSYFMTKLCVDRFSLSNSFQLFPWIFGCIPSILHARQQKSTKSFKHSYWNVEVLCGRGSVHKNYTRPTMVCLLLRGVSWIQQTIFWSNWRMTFFFNFIKKPM